MKRALFSVYVKDGIEDLAQYLSENGYEIVSSGGTFRYLKEKNIPVVEIKEITSFPEVLGGRVKTLHPNVHAGILAMREKPEHLNELKEHDILPIDFVVCNLYPFEATIENEDSTLADIIEKIDIGGVTLLRAAAKNFKDVAVVVDNEDLSALLDELKNSGKVSSETRQRLAMKAFNHTAYYDGIISSYMNRLNGENYPKEFSIPLKKENELRYGENPHQKAALYRNYIDKNNSALNLDVLWGKQLSYNNVMDADAAIDILREYAEEKRPFCVIMKHTNPCGAAIADSVSDAYDKALAGDPISAFGGIIGFNQKVDKTTAEKAIAKFCEIIIAPDYDDDAMETLKSKKNLRILRLKSNDWTKKGFYARRVENGYLVQDWDEIGTGHEEIKTITDKKPTPEQEKDLNFAWKICQYVKSNSIVYVKNEQVIGVGAGQMSRVDSARFGVMKAKEFGFDIKGAVMASDAYFPFRDSVDAAAEHGVSAIIQPGGSIRDEQSITAANEHGIAMAFTGIRHFKH